MDNVSFVDAAARNIEHSVPSTPINTFRPPNDVAEGTLQLFRFPYPGIRGPGPPGSYILQNTNSWTVYRNGAEIGEVAETVQTLLNNNKQKHLKVLGRDFPGDAELERKFLYIGVRPAPDVASDVSSSSD